MEIKKDKLSSGKEIVWVDIQRGRRNYVALIVGKHPRFKFARKFLTRDIKGFLFVHNGIYEIEEGEGRKYYELKNLELKEVTKEYVIERVNNPQTLIEKFFAYLQEKNKYGNVKITTLLPDIIGAYCNGKYISLFIDKKDVWVEPRHLSENKVMEKEIKEYFFKNKKDVKK